MTVTYYTYYESPIGFIEIGGSSDAVTTISFVQDRQTVFQANELVTEAARQLQAYFERDGTHFDLPLAMHGTDFQRSVWTELLAIPFGHTVSYQDIAQALGNPAAVRAVGAANGQNPIPIIVPCHRVIGSNGRLVGYGGGLWRKEWLLKHEGSLLI